MESLAPSSILDQREKSLYLVVVLFILGWAVIHPNFFLLDNAINNLLICLLVIGLFKETRRLEFVFIDCFGWAALASVVFISLQLSENYNLASEKTSLDFKIVLLGFLIYIVFYNEIVKSAEELLLVVVLVFVIVVLPKTLPEMMEAILVGCVRNCSEAGYLTSLFDLSYFRHIRHFSYYAFISSCCSFLLLKFGGGVRLEKGLYFGLFIVSAFSLLLAYGRGSILALICFLVLFYLVDRGLKAAIKIGVLSFVAVILFYSILYFTPLWAVTEFLFGSFLYKGDDALSSSALNSISSGRMALWTSAIEKTFQSPIYGHGTGSTVWLFRGTAFSWAGQPHNALVQWLLDYGWLGAALACWNLLRVFRQSLFKLLSITVSNKHASVGVGVTCLVIAFCVFSLTDGLFYHPLPMIVFAIIAPLSVALNNSERIS